MKYNTIIQYAAVEDFKAAKLWYKNTKAKGLSSRFSNAVKLTITNLQKQPLIFAICYENVCIIYTPKFPFAVHYFVDENLIVITAIIYAGRNPEIALNRV